MATSTTPTPKLFARKFRSAIRVGFNWDRFFEERWPVESVTLESNTDLSKCFMPWYVGKTGQEAAYDDPEAAPMRLTDVPKIMGLLSDERKTDIEKHADAFVNALGIVEFSAPTYALLNDEYFVLDRNHRLSALSLISVPFQIALWNVRGPLDPDCLLDLVHWHAKSERGNQSK